MSELRGILEDTVERLFSDMVTQPLLESVEEGEWPAKLWTAVEECGLTRPHLPEAAGGADGTWEDAFVIMRASGRHCAPIPLAETLLASWLLASAGLDIPDGPLTVLPGPIDAGSVQDGTFTCAARRVPWGRAVDHVVFVSAGQDECRVGCVDLGDATRSWGENIAREPRDDLNIVALRIASIGPLNVPPGIVQLYGAMLRSAQMAGALDMLLAQSVQYVGEREQFGRPLAKFQAIQQQLALLAGQTAATGIAAEVAFHAADRAGTLGVDTATYDPTFEIAAAKVQAGTAAELGTSIAHQVHGAIGFTYEHALHFATRRLWAWRAECGTEAYWAAWLGRRALEMGPDALWPFVTTR